MDGRADLQVSYGYVELPGDTGFAAAVCGHRIWHMARRIRTFLFVSDAADWPTLRRRFQWTLPASRISEKTKSDPNIRLLTMSSASSEARESIKTLRQDYPGPSFAILDSDHSKEHVLAEMIIMRDILAAGDYLVVEDSNINGHPVQKSSGPGPYEAIEEYFRRFPNDYQHDFEREQKFGFSFAPQGFLRRL